MSMNDHDGDLDGVPASPLSFPLFDRAWLSSLNWELRETTVRPMLVAAFDHIDFTNPSGAAAELLQESWKDILAIVQTKNTLLSWVSRLRVRNPAVRASKVKAPAPVVSLSRWFRYYSSLQRWSTPNQVPIIPISRVCHPLTRGVCHSVLQGASATILEASGHVVIANPTRLRINTRHWTSIIRLRCLLKTVRFFHTPKSG